MLDPYTSPEVCELYSRFKIVVMWDNNFVCLCKVSKILNNKHCGLATKMLYQENLGQVRKIWNIYKRPLLNLDTSCQHFKDYKVDIKYFRLAPTISIILTPPN
jgi:hypothetical protein